MKSHSSHTAGILLVVASGGFFGLAGIFTRLANADPWTIAGWRGLVGAVLIALYVAWRARRDGTRHPWRLGWPGFALAVVGAVSSVFFIAAFQNTYVGNVAMIYATVPFMAAAIDFVARGARARKRTLAVSLVSLAGVAIIAFGGRGGDGLLGDLLAVVMTALCALYLVMIRTFHGTPVVWAGAVAALMVFAASWIVTDPLAISAHTAWIIAVFGVAFAAAVILWTEGARRLPPPESGLLGASEVPFAMFFAWLFLGQLPPVESILGGALVLAAVLFHALGDISAAARRPLPAAA